MGNTTYNRRTRAYTWLGRLVAIADETALACDRTVTLFVFGKAIALALLRTTLLGEAQSA
jgi:hypothetical protein